MLTFSVLDRKNTFWAKLDQKIKIVSFKERSDESLVIFWKSPYKKNYEFLKWNNWKSIFFHFSTVFIFDFLKKYEPPSLNFIFGW